jgi:hypothetical protein
MRAYLFGVADKDRALLRPWCIAFALFLCALFSKTVTATLPAAILLLIWWKRGHLRWSDVSPLVPFFIVGLVMAFQTGRLEVEHVGANPATIVELRLSPAQRLLIASRAIWFYAGKLIVPVNLAFIYPRWTSVEQSQPWLWLFTLATFAMIAALFMLRPRIGRGPLTAVLLFCGTLVPALGFVHVYPMRFSFVADHFQYHASIPLIILFVAVCARVLKPTAVPWAFTPLLCILTVLTFSRTQVYEYAETLWRDTLAKYPP